MHTGAALTGKLAAMALAMIGLAAAAVATPARASTAAEIDAKVDAALGRLQEQIPDSRPVIDKARGVLVFAKVIKAGFIIAGEGGEGALRIDGKSIGYYSLFAGSVGIQIGGQQRDIIMLFLDEAALEKFRKSDGWTVGADGTAVLIIRSDGFHVGADGTMTDTNVGVIGPATLNKPIVVFVVGQKGLMAGISLDGMKITPLDR